MSKIAAFAGYKRSLASMLLVCIGWGCAKAQTSRSYVILMDEQFGNVKRSVEVRLPKRIEKKKLYEIANEIKQKNRNSFQRTFILYFLPGMKSGQGAWATSHLNPDLEVKVLGFSKEQYKAVTSAPTHENAIGVWIDESIGISSRLVIFKEDGDYSIETLYGNGSSFVEALRVRDFGDSGQ